MGLGGGEFPSLGECSLVSQISPPLELSSSNWIRLGLRTLVTERAAERAGREPETAQAWHARLARHQPAATDCRCSLRPVTPALFGNFKERLLSKCSWVWRTDNRHHWSLVCRVADFTARNDSAFKGYVDVFKYVSRNSTLHAPCYHTSIILAWTTVKNAFRQITVILSPISYTDVALGRDAIKSGFNVHVGMWALFM